MIAGPSGAGKTSVATGLERRRHDLLLSVSVTTRASRHGESDGVDYRFVSDEEFDAMEREGAFLETALVHGNRYGTPRAPVERGLRAGTTVVLEIDVQGARAVRKQVPDAVLVFVEPPSLEVLEERLRARGTEDANALARRMRNARDEMAAAPDFDHRVVNDDLDRAIAEVIRILEDAEGRPARDPGDTP